MLNKIAIAAVAVMFAAFRPEPAPKVPAEFTGCSLYSGTGNDPKFLDMSETYRCDQGDVRLRGKWGMTVEYGTVYRDEMGRVRDKTEPATEFDRDFFQWCRKDVRQIVLCGDKAGPYHSNLSAIPWYPDPSKYPTAAERGLENEHGNK